MSRRTARIGELIRQVVSRAILFQLRDPRVNGVTVTGVEVAGDLRSARVLVSIMGEEAERRLTLGGLKSSRGFLQRRLAEELELRYTPILEFVEDMGVKKSLEVSRLLKEVLPEDESAEPVTPRSDTSPENED